MRVLACKAKPPIQGGDIIGDEIHRAHRYYNRLVELERAFAAERDAAKRKHVPGLEEAEAAVATARQSLDDLRMEVRQRNAVARRKQATAEDAATIRAARQVLASARAERRQLREQAAENADYQAALGGLIVKYEGEESRDRNGNIRRKGGLKKEARASCGVYSGTYLQIERAIEQAREDTIGDLRFRRWTGDGLVGPQLTPPLRVGDMASGNSNHLRMEVLENPVNPRRSIRVRFHVRVQSDGRQPVWAIIPAHISREMMPHEDEVVCWAAIIRRQVGVRRHRDPNVPEGVYRPYYEWSVNLTLRSDPQKRRAESGVAGVNFGWRQMEGAALRVAMLVSDDGETREIRVPPKVIGRWRKADDIQAIRDRHFNAIRDRLRDWLKDVIVPQWLKDATDSLYAWRSKRRLSGVWSVWSRQRFDGDTEMFSAIDEWCRRDAHLEQYELMLRRKAKRARLAYYRQVAAEIRQRYKTVAVDDTQQADLNRLPLAESNEATIAVARWNARVAAPSELRSLLIESGAVRCDPENITRTCHACGSLETWNQAAELRHTCAGCGADWDQDDNAARNLLARAKEMAGNPAPARDPQGGNGNEDAATSPEAGGRWARRKASRSQRLAETQGN